MRDAEIVTEAGKQSQRLKTIDISYDEKKSRVTLKFPEEIPTAQNAVLTVSFTGILNHEMAGFYRSEYKSAAKDTTAFHDGQNHHMFSTQFESSDARRAFPCMDEPNLKAELTLSLEVPEDQTAISNMPVKETKKSSREGWKIVEFEKAPKMSTYLYAWAFGDFEYIEDHTKRSYQGKRLPVRVYTTKGLKNQGAFALENAHKVIDLFSDVFGVEYPLPKSDLLCVHEFAAGAMEHWGLVTYRTTAVLFDEETSDQKYKNQIAYVVAHELAHQWFGNLVTMDWWSELWLNEGFATWVGWYAVDKLYPDWNVFGQFVCEGGQTALTLDSVRGSHPIEVPVKDALEVDQIFDAISYLKGSSVIRMLAAYLGEDTMLKGVSNYLKKHAYSNATTNDLWSALSSASGKDVNSFADNWVRKIGFPLLTVTEHSGHISVKQSRFLSTGDVKAKDDETTWNVPLIIKTSAQSTEHTTATLTTKKETINNIDGSFYKLNSDTTGFYRTSYPPARLAKLGEQKDQLSVEDKIGLIGDASALAISGDSTTTALLGLLESFQDEKSYLVWQQILISSLGTIQAVFDQDAKISEGLRKYVLKLVSPAVERVGWKFDKSEGFLDAQLRALLIGVAGLAGHEAIIKESMKQFKEFNAGNEKAIHPNLRSAVFKIAVKNGGSEAYEAVKKDFKTTTGVFNKEMDLQAMGNIKSTELATEHFNWMYFSVSQSFPESMISRS